MTTEKKEIFIVGSDESIINLLNYKYNIKKIVSFKDYLLYLEKLYSKGTRVNSSDIADFIIVGNEIEEQEFILTKYSELRKNKKIKLLSTILRLGHELSNTLPKLIGFESGALIIGVINDVNLLYNITNHENTIHSTSFCMPDDKIIDIDVNSNHSHLIIPPRYSTFTILAFSTYNNSQSYTKYNGDTFKATRDFVEIEALKLHYNNSYCFLYSTPQKGDNILIDLTLQLLEQ